MATTLAACAPIVGKISERFLAYQYLREQSALINLVNTKMVDYCGTHLANLLLPGDGLYENCGPSNYPSPECLSNEIRSIDTCSWTKSYKLDNCYVNNNSFRMENFTMDMMRLFAHEGVMTFERIIYKALIDDVVVKSQNTTGGVNVTRTLIDDIGAASIVDASGAGGLTLDKLYEALGVLSTKYRGGLRPILLVPASAWIELQKDIDTAGGKGGPNTCCAYDRGISMEMTGRYGNVIIVKSLVGDKLFRDVGGKLRAFLFQPGSIEVLYTGHSSLTMGGCKDDLIIRPSSSNGYISGIIKVNPGTQFGGLLVQMEMNAGGVRVDPDGIVAIDLAK